MMIHWRDVITQPFGMSLAQAFDVYHHVAKVVELVRRRDGGNTFLKPPDQRFGMPGFSSRFQDELRDVFRRLVLDARDPRVALVRGQLLHPKSRGVAAPPGAMIDGKSRLRDLYPCTVRDELTRHAIANVFYLEGNDTAHSWNKSHPTARRLGKPILTVSDHGFTWSLEYIMDRSAWTRYFRSRPGESFDRFARRYSSNRLRNALPPRPEDW